MIKITLNVDSIFMQSPVTVLIALPYPNLSSEQTKTLFALHCAMKDGHYFFDELGLGSYVDKHNVAIVAPCLGNSFFVDNKFQSAGAFLRKELMPYLKKKFNFSSLPEENFCLGLSMGAYGAANWTLSEDCFSKTFLISGVYDFLLERNEMNKMTRSQKNLLRIVSSMKNVLLEGTEYFEGCCLKDLLTSRQNKLKSEVEIYCGEDDYLSKPQSEYFYNLLKNENCSVSIDFLTGDHDTAFWKKVISHLFASGKLN